MFSPQSIPVPMGTLDSNSNLQLNPTIKSNLSDNYEEGINMTNDNDNIIYEEEDINSSRTHSSLSQSNKSYCGIKANSVLSGILNICASAVGAGCFTFPWIIANLGIINSTFIFIIVTLCIYYSFDLLRSFVVDTKYFSFSLMTETTLGKKWLMVYSFSSFIYYLSININYLSLLYSIFKSCFISHSTFIGFNFLLFTCSIEIFLCLYTNKIEKLNLFSIFTMANFAIIVLVTIIEGIHSSIKNEYIGEKFSTQNLLNPSKDESRWKVFFASITACIKYIYGYSYNCSFPTLIGNLKNVNDSNSKKVHNISFIIISSTYFLIGFFGYLFRDHVPTVLFREYEDSMETDYFTISIKVILFFFLFSLIPNRYIVIRDGYNLLIGKEKLTYKKDLLITTLTLVLSNGIVFLNEELFVEEGNIQIDIFSIMVYIFGGLFGVIISFGLPVINYAAVNGKKKLKSLIGYGITGLFLVIGLLSFGYSFYELTNKNEDE